MNLKTNIYNQCGYVQCALLLVILVLCVLNFKVAATETAAANINVFLSHYSPGNLKSNNGSSNSSSTGPFVVDVGVVQNIYAYCELDGEAALFVGTTWLCDPPAGAFLSTNFGNYDAGGIVQNWPTTGNPTRIGWYISDVTYTLTASGVCPLTGEPAVATDTFTVFGIKLEEDFLFNVAAPNAPLILGSPDPNSNWMSATEAWRTSTNSFGFDGQWSVVNMMENTATVGVLQTGKSHREFTLINGNVVRQTDFDDALDAWNKPIIAEPIEVPSGGTGELIWNDGPTAGLTNCSSTVTPNVQVQSFSWIDTYYAYVVVMSSAVCVEADQCTNNWVPYSQMNNWKISVSNIYLPATNSFTIAAPQFTQNAVPLLQAPIWTQGVIKPSFVKDSDGCLNFP